LAEVEMSPSETSPLAASLRMNRTLPAIETVRSALVEPVRAAAFWTAITLPLVYVPMLATGAIGEHPVALLALIALNAVAFVVGHEHNQPDASR
jgi:hypothetical protein